MDDILREIQASDFDSQIEATKALFFDADEDVSQMNASPTLRRHS